jgi:hypothetical protein
MSIARDQPRSISRARSAALDQPRSTGCFAFSQPAMPSGIT